MLRQHRWARVACVFAGVLVAFQIHAQVPVFGPRTKPPPPAALASPVIATPAAGTWGVFERLVGQELKSNAGGYSVRFSWVRPGEELLQEWVHPRTGKVMGTAVTVRDPATGQLREGKTAAASATGYLGTLAADGSVGFLKGSSGYRWQLAAVRGTRGPESGGRTGRRQAGIALRALGFACGGFHSRRCARRSRAAASHRCTRRGRSARSPYLRRRACPSRGSCSHHLRRGARGGPAAGRYRARQVGRYSGNRRRR